MTEKELDALEAAAKAATPGPWQLDAEADTTVDNQIVKDGIYIAAANPAVVLELIAELRQARAERDWLAEKNQDAPCELGMECLHPDSIPKNKNHVCNPAECWLELAAKEATCSRKD